VPNNVAHWTNLADGNDIVAVTGALAGDFVPSDAGVEVVDHRVVNDYRRPTGKVNHHKSYGYLRTPEFSRIAAGFVGAASQRTCETPALGHLGVSPKLRSSCRGSMSHEEAEDTTI